MEAFLTHVTVQQHVAASSQNQAVSALLFLHRQVRKKPLNLPVDAVRVQKPKRLPTVLTRDEARNVIRTLPATHQLMAKLLFGSRLRLLECLRLRVKELEFPQRQTIVRDGKGMGDRVAMLHRWRSRLEGSPYCSTRSAWHRFSYDVLGHRETPLASREGLWAVEVGFPLTHFYSVHEPVT